MRYERAFPDFDGKLIISDSLVIVEADMIDCDLVTGTQLASEEEAAQLIKMFEDNEYSATDEPYAEGNIFEKYHELRQFRP